MIAHAFDAVLALLIVLCAGAAIVSAELLRAIVFFIVFGLLMAVGWLRLQAPDVALAEAAVGAGLTGVLLVEALGRIHRLSKSGRRRDHG